MVIAEATDDQLTAALRARGHRVTLPRLVVHRHVRRTGGHVTAEQVSSQLARDVPSLSPATVYATLDLLDELGLVRRISTPGGVAVYDARPDAHHHLVCRRCGAAADVDCVIGSAPCLEPSDTHGFAVDEAEVVFWGLCPDCQEPSRRAHHEEDHA
jgi:Fur family transcriptional regulator, stress-responsive regulator